MKIDPLTVILLIVIGSALMGGGLRAVARGYLRQMQGLSRWATATLMQTLGWVVLALLRGAIPEVVSVVLGNALILASFATYLLILAEFNATPQRASRVYGLVPVQMAVLTYFTVFNPNLGARIVVISGCASWMMLRTAFVLFAAHSEPRSRPASHTFTAGLFAFSGTFLLVRTVYYLVLDNTQAPFGMDAMNQISYLVFYVITVMLSFGFVLMCNERYVAQRALVEEALRESETHTRTIIDALSDGLVVLNAQGLIESVNPAATSLFGYSLTEVNDKPFSYLLASAGFDLAQSMGRTIETEGRRKDGSMFPVDVSASLSNHQGQALTIVLVRDITERKRNDQLKTEFVSTVSHELRTPLTSISGSLGLIAGGAMGELPTAMKPMLDIAHKNSLRLSHLINDLLDMEKLLAGKVQFNFLVQPVMPLIEQCVAATQGFGDEYHVTYVINRRADDVQVRVDGMRLQQVLTNFLSNAAKFSPAGAQVEVQVEQSGNLVRVAVVDHGAGIPDEFRSRIFEKFSQADSSDTRQKGGTGLGLAISKEMIERMNGSIAFTSVAGQGACFYFELPVVQEITASSLLAQSDEAPAINANGPRILVIEDWPDIASLMSTILVNAGYRVDIAANGATALKLMTEVSYAVATIDLTLPDISGASLVRLVRSNESLQRLPLIIVSAYIEDVRPTMSQEFEFIDWVEKPFEHEHLVATVARAISGGVNGQG